MKKILVTGASGFLGWNFCRTEKYRHKVSGIFNSKEIEMSGVDLYKCDICDYWKFKQLFNTINPDVVIHAAAISSPNICEENPEKSFKVNVGASEFLACLCSDRSIPFIFTSSDLVFDGICAPYNESNAPNPLNLYGKQKLEAEQKILAIHKGAVICRMPLMFGDSPSSAASFITPWVEKLRKREELKLFTDEFRTPISVLDAIQGLFLAAENVTGIIHLGGKERLSRYEMGKKIAKIAGINSDLIKACSQKDIKMSAPRPADVSFDSSKAFFLGFNPGFFEEELKKLEMIK